MELYETTKKLDLRRAVCPSTFSMTKHALTSVESGDVIQVRVNPGEHMENVPSAVLNDGHQVLDIVKDGSSYVLYIMKQ
jgi:TusA-related sulfurtransferase